MNYKKAISLILTVLMLVGMASIFAVGSAASAAPEIRVGTAEADPGDEISLNVDFLNNPGINSYTLSIVYDTSRLELIGAAPNQSLGGQFAFAKKAVWLASNDIDYSGTFLTLAFRVLDNAPEGEAQVGVRYNAGDICNRNEDDVDFALVDGCVTVNGAAHQAGTIRVGSASGKPGETVTVNVDFLDNPGFNTFALSIDYDAERLSLVDAAVNPDVGGQFAFSRKAVWLASADTDFCGTFLTLTFTILPDAPEGDAFVSVSYNPGDICNYNEQDVDFEIEAGAVTVEADEEFTGPKWSVDNYDFIISNAVLKNGSYINAMRIAPGVYTTSNEIRNAPGMVTVNEALCRSYTDADGKLTYNFINAGTYSIWIRYKKPDGSTVAFILGGEGQNIADYPSVVLDTFTPKLGAVNGITFTVDNIWLDSSKGLKDFFLARGHWDTYSDCKSSANMIVRILASNVDTADYNYKRSYKYEMSYKNVSEDGKYTIWFRTNDGRGWAEQFTIEYPQPEVLVNGLQATVTDLLGESFSIKTIRVAPGEWADASAVKKAPGVRVFTVKDVLKNKSEYTVQFRNDGKYTFSIEYQGGYTKVVTIQITHLAPTVTVNADNTVTLDDLDQLYIIRYAPNPKNSTDWSQGYFKQAAGNRYAKTANLVDGKFTTEVLPEVQYVKDGQTLTSNIWSFMVQYNEESFNIITVNFNTGTVTTIKP
ncbi:MAG: hypothetical protein IJR90_03040 [Clostridia bacterium]|nr:hypothetical protein [Clostridia bacterium]